MLFKPLLAFTLLGSTFATSVLPRTPLSLNPPASVAEQHQKNSRRSVQVDDHAPSPSPVVHMTNAGRMAAGLPPLPPRRRGSRTSHAARSAPSAGALATHGYIAARASGTSTLMGYIKEEYNAFGEKGLTSPTSTNGALKVILPAADKRTGPFNLAPETFAQTDYPLLGFIPGFANTSPDLGPGSFNFLYMSGVPETPSYSPPVLHDNTFSVATGLEALVESAVWHYDDATGKLTPQWINTDGGIPDIYYCYYVPDHTLIATGDPVAFMVNYGADYTQCLDFYYVVIEDAAP